MDLDCAFEFGLTEKVVKQCRKDWSLAHDVKLLKYLEKFSQNLIFRSEEALKSLESFEQNLYSASLNIQTVTQKFQSLANKQFIEHCVLEDDISSYSKPSENVIEISSSTSKILLNNALSSCISSDQLKRSNYKEGYLTTKSNHVPGAVHSQEPLFPLIGTSAFNDYYSNFLGSKEYCEDSMKKSEDYLEDNYSDKNSLQDNLSLCSSANVLSDSITNPPQVNRIDTNEDKTLDKTTSCHEKKNENTDPQPKVLSDDSKEKDSKRWTPDNLFFHSNSYTNVVPPVSQSLFDDDDNADDDLFLFSQNKPFFKTPFAEDDDDDEINVEGKSKNNISSWDQCDAETHTKINMPHPSSEIASNNKTEPTGLINDSNKLFKNHIINLNKALTDSFNHNSERKINCLKSSSKLSNEIVTEEKTVPHIQSSQDKFSESVDSCKLESKKVQENQLSTSVKDPDSTDKFKLFSDQDDSDDELFSSIKQKEAKEHFKKILEEKVSLFGKERTIGIPSKSSSNEVLNNSESPKVIPSATAEGSVNEDSLLPNYNTDRLHCVVKNRAKIRSKRRPPSRKHLKEIHTTDSNESENQIEKSNKSMLSSNTILSPSTEEEDLFIVPTPSIVHEVSCSNLFLDSSLLSPGSSLDHQVGSNDFVPEDQFASVMPKSNLVSTYQDCVDEKVYKKNESIVSSGLSNGKPYSNKNISNPFEASSKLFSGNSRSLFNDSEDDEDDLFSSIPSKKTVFEVHSKKSVIPASDNRPFNTKSSKEFFKDVFSNDSDDDDLFKIKGTTAPSDRPESLFKPSATKHISILNGMPTKVKEEKVDYNIEPNGTPIFQSTSDFKDPLSCFEEGQTE